MATELEKAARQLKKMQAGGWEIFKLQRSLYATDGLCHLLAYREGHESMVETDLKEDVADILFTVGDELLHKVYALAKIQNGQLLILQVIPLKELWPEW